MGTETPSTGRLWLAGLLVFGLMLPVTALVPVLQEITGGRFPEISVLEKHLFMSANMIGAFVFAPVAGLLSDVLGKRTMLIAGAFFINAAMLLLMRLEWPYYGYLTLRLFEGCAHITSLSLLMALTLDGSGPERRGRAFGAIGAALTLGVAVGAPIGGLLGEREPLAVFIQGGILMAVLGGVALLFLRDVRFQTARPSASDVLRSLRECRLLAVPYTFTFVDRLTVGFIVSTLALYLRNEMGGSPVRIGWILALFLLPFALLTYPSGKLSQRVNKLKMIIGGSLLYGLILAAIGFADLPAIHGLMLVGGIAAALMFAPSLVLVGQLADERNRAVAMAGFNTAGSLGFLIGPLFGGAAVTVFAQTPLPPYPAAFALAGALEIACAVGFLPFVRRVS